MTPKAAVSADPSAVPTNAPPLSTLISVANSVASTPCSAQGASQTSSARDGVSMTNRFRKLSSQFCVCALSNGAEADSRARDGHEGMQDGVTPIG